MTEPELFMWGDDGFIKRRYRDNIFCLICGKDLTPDESYGKSPEELSICIECGRIIMGEKYP